MNRWTCILLAFCLFPSFAFAQVGPREVSHWRPPKTSGSYVLDLESSDRADRLFAARELRRQLKELSRKAARGGSSLNGQTAMVDLADLKDAVRGPARRAMLEYPNVRALCADLLVLVGNPADLGALQRAYEVEHRRRVLRRILRDMEILEGGASS